MWDLIVSVSDHCLSFNFDCFFFFFFFHIFKFWHFFLNDLLNNRMTW